jgi:hypothetical protein
MKISLGLHALSHLPKAEFDDLMIFNKSVTQNHIILLIEKKNYLLI